MMKRVEERSSGDIDVGSDYLTLAGVRLLQLMRKTIKFPEQDDANVWGIYLSDARTLLERVKISDDNRHKYLALKTAIEFGERVNNGDELGPEATNSALDIFRTSVETLLTGPRKLDFGGRKPTPNRLAVEIHALRAALVCLWEEFPEKREQLAKDAKKLLGIKGKDQIRKIVENHHQRHDHDLYKSRSPLSIHLGFAKELIKNHDYNKLTDFT